MFPRASFFPLDDMMWEPTKTAKKWAQQKTHDQNMLHPRREDDFRGGRATGAVIFGRVDSQGWAVLGAGTSSIPDERPSRLGFLSGVELTWTGQDALDDQSVLGELPSGDLPEDGLNFIARTIVNICA